MLVKGITIQQLYPNKQEKHVKQERAYIHVSPVPYKSFDIFYRAIEMKKR
jgi:hypothetical protein